MPTDQFIEELTDGSPSVAGDLFAIQRQVNGVWQDFFIRAENITGAGVLTADVDVLVNVSVGVLPVILPAVAGKVYVVVSPPVFIISGHTPSNASLTIGIASASSGDQQWASSITDSESDAAYSINGRSYAVLLDLANPADLTLYVSSFDWNGLTVRVILEYALLDI
jgi:hypothetical protein